MEYLNQNFQKCDNCGSNCFKCANFTGACESCIQGFNLKADKSSKDCERAALTIDVDSTYFDKVNLKIRVKFNRKVRFNNPKQIRAFVEIQDPEALDEEPRRVFLDLESLNLAGNKQEITLKLNFDEF